MPTTFLDAASLIHDIEYIYYSDQTIPDNNMFKNLLPYSLIVASVTRAAFLVKDIVGYSFPLERKELYLELKQRAHKLLASYPGMKFADER